MNGPSSTTTPTTNGKGSVSGFVIALLSIAASGIGSLLINAKATPGPNLPKAVDTVQSGTAQVATSLMGVPFLVLGISLALVALLVVILRLRNKSSGDGLLLSIPPVALSVWSLSIALSAFGLISAR